MGYSGVLLSYTVDRIVLNLEEINYHLNCCIQNCDFQYNMNMRVLQQCLDQLLVHWRSKLSIMEAHGGRLKETINIELVKIELIPIPDRYVCIK